MFHRLVDRFGGFELVRSGQEIDGHRTAWLAVQPAEGVVILRAEFSAPDVLDLDDGASRALPDYDVFELLCRDQATRSADRVGELLILRRGRAPDPPRRRLDVLLVDGRDNIRRR